MRTSVLAVGAVMVDTMCSVSCLPASGEGVVAESFRTTIGGCAFNSANVIRQLGVACTLFAPIGEGVHAELIIRALADCRLVSPVHVCGKDNGLCMCLIEPSGQRSMITIPGIERFFERSWFDGIDASCFSYGIVSGYEIEGSGGDSIIEFFENHPEIQLYYAPGPRIKGVGTKKTARINALHPVWHLNDQEACAYIGCSLVEDAGRTLVRACENTVVITAGSQGAYLFEHSCGSHCVVPAKPVNIIDTVGAGDAHLGALVACRAKGFSWIDALSVANGVAGGVCGKVGTTLTDEEFARLNVKRSIT